MHFQTSDWLFCLRSKSTKSDKPTETPSEEHEDTKQMNVHQIKVLYATGQLMFKCQSPENSQDHKTEGQFILMGSKNIHSKFIKHTWTLVLGVCQTGSHVILLLDRKSLGSIKSIQCVSRQFLKV